MKIDRQSVPLYKLFIAMACQESTFSFVVHYEQLGKVIVSKAMNIKKSNCYKGHEYCTNLED